MSNIYNPVTAIIRPVINATLEICHLVVKNFNVLARYLSIAILCFVLVSTLGHYELAIRSLTWVILGVASSIGFGFGMHTFVLFLAPHIASVTIAAHECKSLNFPEPPYPLEFKCPKEEYAVDITYMMILKKIGLESFMWGLGTAIGELPPYLVARLRAKAMGRKAGGDDLADSDRDINIAYWESYMIKIVEKVGFLGILLCAAIPNPLFDAAGVASGTAQIPFLSFFGATFIGKALIKVFLQSSFVVLAFHQDNLDKVIRQTDLRLCELFPSIKSFNITQSMTMFLNEIRSGVLSKSADEHKQVSLVQSLFRYIIWICFALFFWSLVKALDAQYCKRKDSLKRRID